MNHHDFCTNMQIISITLFILSTGVTCPSGSKSPGGKCECEKLDLWNEGTWTIPTCDEGLCKIYQTYAKCKGKQNGHQLGDGSWCWNEDRSAKCPLAAGLIH